jgi:hypothetical protein
MGVITLRMVRVALSNDPLEHREIGARLWPLCMPTCLLLPRHRPGGVHEERSCEHAGVGERPGVLAPVWKDDVSSSKATPKPHLSSEEGHGDAGLGPAVICNHHSVA